jgi:hypothetical protein
MNNDSYRGVAFSCDSAVRDPLLLILLIACLVTVLLLWHVLRRGREQRHVGLTLSFLLGGFWMSYWFAQATYLVPGYCGIYPEFEVPGARQTLYAFLGFAVGVLFVPKLFGFHSSKQTRSAPPPPAPPVPDKLRFTLLGLGVLFYIGAHLVARVRGAQGILSSGQQLLLPAILLNIWEAARKKRNTEVTFWTALSFGYPCLTVVQDGFLGFGIRLVAPVLIFVTTCIGRRNYFRVTIFGVVGLYLGLSLYVSYMRDRTEIRANVWGGGRLSSRVERFAQTFEHFEWFSPTNPNHLDAVTARLNQNWLVGAGVVYVDNTQQWARGETLKYAALAFVPRLLWPDKPQTGNTDLVTRYTGIRFAEGTSVGIGPVMELYVNFGSWLVFFGFVVFGALSEYLDFAAGNGLKTGSYDRFITCFVVALPVVQMTEDITTMCTTVTLALMLTYGLQMFLRMKSRKRMQPAVQPAVLRPRMRPVLPR